MRPSAAPRWCALARGAGLLVTGGRGPASCDRPGCSHSRHGTERNRPARDLLAVMAARWWNAAGLVGNPMLDS